MNVKIETLQKNIVLIGMLVAMQLSAAPMVLVGEGDNIASGWALTDSSAGLVTTYDGTGGGSEVGLYADDAARSTNNVILDTTAMTAKTDSFLINNNSNSNLFSVGQNGATSINSVTDFVNGTGAVSIGNVTAGDISLVTSSTSQITVGDTNTLVQGVTTDIVGTTTNINTDNSVARATNIGNDNVGSTTNIIGVTNINATTAATTNLGTGTGAVNVGNTTGATVVNGNAVTLQSGMKSLVVDSTGTSITGGLIVDGLSLSGATNGAINLTVNNPTTGIAHGLVVQNDQTILSGGVNSTYITLDEKGASFAHPITGAPSRVMGVADGVDPMDAG
ncbi:MAG: hypothetical protein HOB39_04270 [Gammaproteobacteria bacterium]|nr:hypothetical protein [Gammaproteobacteria bacterium]